MCKPSRNGKEGRVYPGVGGALLLLLLLAVCVCSECTGEGREIEGLVPIILRDRPVCTLLVACHRFKRIQANPLRLPEL